MNGLVITIVVTLVAIFFGMGFNILEKCNNNDIRYFKSSEYSSIHMRNEEIDNYTKIEVANREITKNT